MDVEKLVAQKTQLASLCRSLQQENAALRDQLAKGPNLRASLDAVSSKYEALVADLKTKYESAGTDLETLKDRFRAFLSETEAREAHSAAATKAKELEIALGVARLKEQTQLREQAMKQVELLTAELSLRAQTETELKRQLDLYVDKFKQVEGTLTKSNDLFVSFRKEMESMGKKTKKLEKENASMRARHDALNATALKMAEERAEHLKIIQTDRTKREQLEKLCRALQDERRVLKEQVQKPEPEKDEETRSMKPPQETTVTDTLTGTDESDKSIPSNS